MLFLPLFLFFFRCYFYFLFFLFRFLYFFCHRCRSTQRRYVAGLFHDFFFLFIFSFFFSFFLFVVSLKRRNIVLLFLFECFSNLFSTKRFSLYQVSVPGIIPSSLYLGLGPAGSRKKPCNRSWRSYKLARYFKYRFQILVQIALVFINCEPTGDLFSKCWILTIIYIYIIFQYLWQTYSQRICLSNSNFK